jgi:hypothetical protein
MPQSDQGTSGSASGSSASTSQSAASGTSYDGCIKEKGGKYYLQTADGQKYQLNSTQDLSAHKGHEVRVTGDTGTGSSSAASTSGASSSNSGKNAQSLTVSNIEMVADNCKMKKNKDKSSSGMSSGNTDTTGAASNPSGTTNPR